MISKSEAKAKKQEQKQQHTENQSSETWQDNASRVNYLQMVADAEAAGFNPLTALRLGGAAGYTQTSHYGLTESNVKSETIGTAMVPGTPIIGPALSNAGQIIGNSISSYDPMKQALQEAEYDLAQAQIRNLNADTGARLRASVGGIPTWSAGQVAKNPATGKLSIVGTPGSDGSSMIPSFEAPTVTNPWPTSWGFKVNPDVLDADAFEQRYGDSEISQMLYGAAVGWQDFRRSNIYGIARDAWLGVPKQGSARWGY